MEKENKMYLFNPFRIKNSSEKELAEMYHDQFQNLIEEPNTMYEYASNIEIYANLMYLLGEVIARLTKDVLEVKTRIKIDSAIKCVDERNKWDKELDGKPPAMAYFEALGTQYCEKDINILADKECSLKRFKNASESIQEKMNALKKKMESIRFEEF